MESTMAHAGMDPCMAFDEEPVQNPATVDGTDFEPHQSVHQLDPTGANDCTEQTFADPTSSHILSSASNVEHEADEYVPARPITKIWQGVKQRCKRMAYKLPDVGCSNFTANSDNDSNAILTDVNQQNSVMHVDTNDDSSVSVAARSGLMFPQPLIDQPSTSEAIVGDDVPDIMMQQYNGLDFNKSESAEPGTSRVSLAELEAQAVLQCARMIAEERHPAGMLEANSLDKTQKKRSRATMSPTRLEAVRKKQAERQRQTRAAMTPEELEAFRKKQALQKRMKRASLSPESLKRVREEQAARKRKAYAAMTPEQLKAFRDKQAARKRQAYAAMSPEQLTEFRKVQVQRKRKARAEMTIEQLQAFRDKQAAQKREARAKMTSEQLQRFRDDQAERQRKARASMSAEELKDLRDKQAAEKREKRLQQKITESIEHLTETIVAAQQEANQASSPLDPSLLAPFAEDWKNFIPPSTL